MKPGVAVVVLAWKGKKVVIGKRKGSYGDGTWAFPGGMLEFGESFESCAIREVLEETGLHLSKPERVACINSIGEQHYVLIIVKGLIEEGDPKVMESDKCSEWRWSEWNEFPEPVFHSVNQIAALRNTVTHF